MYSMLNVFSNSVAALTGALGVINILNFNAYLKLANWAPTVPFARPSGMKWVLKVKRHKNIHILRWTNKKGANKQTNGQTGG